MAVSDANQNTPVHFLNKSCTTINRRQIERNKVKDYDIIFVDATKIFKQLKFNGKVEKHT